MLYFKNGRLPVPWPSSDLLWSCRLVPHPHCCLWGVGVGVLEGSGRTSGLLAARWAPGVPTRALTQAAALSLRPASLLARPGGFFGDLGLAAAAWDSLPAAEAGGCVSGPRPPGHTVLVPPLQSGCVGLSCPLGRELPCLRPAAVDRAGAWTAQGTGQVRCCTWRVCSHTATEEPRPRPCKPRVGVKAAWTEVGLRAAGCRCFQQGDRVTVPSAECSGPFGLQVPLSGTPHPRCCTSRITHTSLRRLTVGRSSEGS